MNLKLLFFCLSLLYMNIGLVKSNDKNLPLQCIQQNEQSLNFDFGQGKVKEGFTQVSAQTLYSEQTGFGIIPFGAVNEFSQKRMDELLSDGLSSEAPFYFQVDLPEGRYKITLALGSSEENSAITVKAESRRLMLENVGIKKGDVVTKTIVVDVRSPRISPADSIRLKSRELPYKNWDKSLNLEFNGKNPSVRFIQIEKADDLPVIFLAGNSTVTDQENEPWASWGQMFPRFLKPDVVVANFAESGETLKAFKREKRLEKIISVMKPGDYLLMEFAHNDQKPGGNHVDPYTTYQEELMFFITEARKKGGKPVLVTSTNRRSFDEQGKIKNTLEEYPDAMRQLAAKENIPLIDLNAMSKILYESLGVEDSKNAFVHYAANTFPNQKEPLADNTHFNAYGAYELVKCVVQQILDKKLDIKKYIVDDFGKFDPSNPDPFKGFFWPNSPAVEIAKPDGN